MKKLLYLFAFLLIITQLNAKEYQVSYDPDYAPYSYSVNNKAQGFLIDIWKAWGVANNYDVKFVEAKTWDEALELAKTSQVDYFLGTNPYEDWMIASKPIYKTKSSLFIRKNFKKKVQTVGLVGNDYEEFLKSKLTHITISTYDTYDELVNALISSKVDAIYDDAIAISSFVFQHRQNHLVEKTDRLLTANDISAISNNKKKIKIFNDGFKNITSKTLETIENNWIMDKSDFYYKNSNSTIKSEKNISATDILTPEEKAWIETHTVTIGVEPWEPVIFMNDKGEVSGISGDFTRRVVQNTGLKVKYISKEWKVLLKEFENREIDILPDVYQTDEREKFGLFGSGYFKMKDYLYVKEKNTNITSMDDLSGKTLAIQDGNGNIKNIKKMFPTIKLLFTKDAADSIQKVLKGDADALYAGQVIVETIIKEELIVGIKGIRQIAFKAPSLHFMSNTDIPILQTIIQKGLNQIKYKDRQTIISTWVNANNSIKFNEDELKYLAQDKIIKFVFDPDWKPMEWQNDIGEHVGIISDLIKLIEQKSELNLEPIQSNNWTQAIEKVKSGEALMFSGIGETQKRKEYLQFTQKNLFSTPLVIVSRKGDDFKNGFNNINGRRIAAHTDSTAYGILHEKRPNLKFISLSTEVDMFNQLRNKKIDAFVVNAATANYYIKHLKYNDLQISYKTKYNLDLKIAIKKGLPKELLSILNKSIDAISEKEISDIVYKWTEAGVSKNWKDYWVEILEVTAIVSLILLFILWNNRKLKFMVEEKTIELRELLDSLEIKVQERTADLNQAKKEVEAIHKHTRESIEYASLIQGALIPEKDILSSYFKDYFVHWLPKDTVGGDIWLFDKLRHKDECLLFFIDCTGHGVPGAFVTMIVKAVEREIIVKIKDNPEMDVSPAWVMSYFNRTMKSLLKQETKDSKSNAGWDGGIIYYNKKTSILKFAGAETPLFYVDENQDFKTIKGNRYSVGYKKCAMNYEYKETVLEVKEGMKFYCTTDGYLDQNGGAKGFPFGKKRFSNIIKENHTQTMNEQEKIFLKEMLEYESTIVNNDRNDDMTVIGFEI